MDKDMNSGGSRRIDAGGDVKLVESTRDHPEGNRPRPATEAQKAAKEEAPAPTTAQAAEAAPSAAAGTAAKNRKSTQE